MGASATLEPVKRVARTVIAVVIALASVVPWVIGMVQGNVEVGPGVTAAFSQLTIVSAGVTTFAASPAGNYVFSLIGLDATAVAKVTDDVSKTAADTKDGVDSTVAAVNVTTADVKQTIADAKSAADPADTTDLSAKPTNPADVAELDQ